MSFERKGETVSVAIDGVYYPGRIMNTSTDGYGIQLMSELDSRLVDQLVAEFGVREAA